MSVENKGHQKAAMQHKGLNVQKGRQQLKNKNGGGNTFGKKRKSLISADKVNQPQQKKPRGDGFNEIDFKVLLRDPSSVYSGLEKFIEAAEKCSAGSSDYDIVEGFCRSSPECAEITQLLDGERRKLPELQLIFSCLEKILIRIASDLPTYTSVGMKVVKKLLPVHLPSIYFTLKADNRSSQIKTTVKLLVAMVMLGDSAARWVLNHFDFGHSYVRSLFNRRDVKDEDDVRTCMLHFVLAFLLTDRNDIIRQIMDKKGLLACMLEGMVYDRVPTIQLVLNTVLEKIVESQFLTVTAKLYTFTDKTLKQLGLLYHWKGPTKWKDSIRGHGRRPQSKKKKPEETGESEEQTEERKLVSEAVHKLLTELCTVEKHRIFSSSQPVGKAESQILSSFLQYLSTVSQHKLVQDLVVKLLAICPEQLHGYVTKIAHTLTPRLLPRWVDSVNFLCKIYDSQLIDSVVGAFDNSKPTTDLVHILVQHTLPPPQVLTVVLSGMKEQSLAINHVTLAVVKQTGECAVRALEAVARWSSKTSYTPEKMADIHNLYTDAVMKALPNVHTLFAYWDKIQLQLNGKMDKSELQQMIDFCQADLLQALVRVEQVLCLYQALTPTLLVNHVFALGKLLDGVLSTNLSGQALSPDSAYLLQMYLLKLLAGTDAGRLPFGKQNAAHHTLIYQLLEMVPQVNNQPRMKHITVELICQVLHNTGAFESCYDELMVWMTKLQNFDHKSEASSAVLDFVAKVMLRYMGNPFPYMDKVCDLVSEVTVMETRKEGGTRLEGKLQDILHEEAIDLEVEDNDGQDVPKDALKRFPFCPVLLVAMETVENMENVHEDLKVYISSVLLDTFHLQVDPVPLCMCAKGFPAHLFVNGILDYIALWLPETKPQSPKKSKKASSMTSKDGSLLLMEKCSSLRASLGSQEMDRAVTVQEGLLYLTYLIRHGHGDNLKNELPKVIGTIEEAVTEILTTEKEVNIEESSLLNVKKLSHKDLAVKAVQSVLNHPKVRQYFYAEILEMGLPDKTSSSTIAHGVTKLAVSMLKTVQKNGLDVESCAEYFQYRILDCLKVLPSLKDGNQHLKHLCNGLECIVDGLSCNKCVNILDSVLALSSVREDMVDTLCAITNTLMRKLMTTDTNEIKLSRSGAKQLISCYSMQTDSSCCEVLVEFFSTLPNLAVFVHSVDLELILRSSLDVKLVQVLITHNVSVRERFGELILTEGSCLDTDRHLPLVVTFLDLASTANVYNQQDIMQKMEELYKTDLLDLCGVADMERQEHLVEFCQQLIKLQALGHKTLRKMEKKLLATISGMDAVQTHHIQLIDAIWSLTPSAVSDTHEENRHRMLLICVELLAKMLKKKEKHNQTMENKLLQILDTFSSTEIEGLRTAVDIWPKFLKYTLKHCYTDCRLLRFLVKAAPVMYQGQSADTLDTLETAVAMVMSHSSFFTVMFNEESEDCKEVLLDLLLVLIALIPSSCSTDHLGVLLGAYGATLSLTDQKILKLLQLYEANGVHFIEFRPFLWGKKAIEHQQMGKPGQTLHRQPGIGHVISNLDNDRMSNTIRNFPILRNLQMTEVQTAVLYKSNSDCYDPGFLLPLLSHLLASDSVVNCKRFIESDCLSFTFMALTSHDEMVRSAAYHVLDRYRLHIEGARFSEKDQVVNLLHLLHNSVGTSKLRLASIYAMFLARTVKLLLKPGNHMYGVINAFLMHKPRLDIEEVPEFYKLFNSSAWEYKTERMWMLSLMCDGLREKEDYKIFEKRYIFKLLQSFHQSSLADDKCQIMLLQILERACSEPVVATTLVGSHGLMAWISTVVTELSANNSNQVELLISLVSILWQSLKGQADPQAKGHLVRPAIIGQVLSVLRGLLWIARGCSLESLVLLARTLQSVLHYPDTAIFSGDLKPVLATPHCLTDADALVFLFHSGRYLQSKITPGAIKKVLKLLGFHADQLECSGDRSEVYDTLQYQDIGETDVVVEKKKNEEENKEVIDDLMADSPKKVSEESCKNDDTITKQQKTMKELMQTTVELLLCRNQVAVSENTAVTSASLIQMTWLIGLVGQPGLPLQLETVGKAVAYTEQMLVRNENSLLLELLISNSDLSTYMVSSVLNIYKMVMEELKMQFNIRIGSYNRTTIIRWLNNILLVLASKQFAETESEQQLIADCRLSPFALCEELEQQSLILRSLYLTRSPSKEDLDLLLSQKAHKWSN